MTDASCRNLNALAGSYFAALPVDPKLGSNARTYYAIKSFGSGRLRVRACGAELGEEIVLEQ